MAKPAFEDDKDEKPLDPAVERVRRKLVRFVGINLGLLFLALMAVALAIVYKSRTPAAEAPRSEISEIQAPASGGTLQGDILLPAGAKLLSQSLSGNRISLLTELSDGSQAILLFDIAESRLIGRFPVKAQ
ncbi:fimbrial protein [Mesorhizobium sp. 1B3]|uniref:fimbrial protein n=1 Tax=Mesorhizobium sp. 1B3 TaxID=3243599 RepID=UPI003D97D9C4